MALRMELEMGGVGLTASFEASLTGETARIIAAHEAFPEICVEELERAADRAGEILMDVWGGMAPVDTGEYKASLDMSVTEFGPENVVLDVWNYAEHAPHIEYGTGSRGRGYIYPYDGKFMTFRKPGGSSREWVRAHRVRGQRPQHVARRASAAARPFMMAQFRLATNRAHNRLKAIL